MIKKILFFCLFIFSFNFLASAADFKFFVEPHFSFGGGKTEESFYSGSDSDFRVSLLEWQKTNIFSFGFDLGLNLKHFFIDAGFSAALPLDAGKMKDYDWSQYSGLNTTYSIHELSVKTGTDTFLRAGYEFFPCEKLHVSPVIEADYSYYSLKAENGEGWYGSPDSWDSPSAVYYGKDRLYGINLESHSLNIFSGAGLKIPTDDKFTASFILLVSPFSYSALYDTHLNSGSGHHYNSVVFSNFTRFKTEISVDYAFTERVLFNFCFSADWSLKTGKGDLYYDYYTEKPTLSDQKSGFYEYSFRIKSGVKIRIGKKCG